MPAWIHDRAMKMKKDMEKTYGPEKAKQVAFAVATQRDDNDSYTVSAMLP